MLFREKIALTFADDSLLLDKYESVTLQCSASIGKMRTYRGDDGTSLGAKYASAATPSDEPINRTPVDFFANPLFLSEQIRYAQAFRRKTG